MKSAPSTATPALAQDILVVDADPATLAAFKSLRPTGSLRGAASSDLALLAMKHRPAEAVFLNLQIDDNHGAELLRQFRRQFPAVPVVALSRSRRHEITLEAFRAGAADVLACPADPTELQQSLAAIARRRAAEERAAYRSARLRRVCKQLNKARHEIRQQVDLLCNDLVRAYQDMAVQLNAAQVAADFAAAVGPELEVEGLLRKTMEWILRKFGPVNAAIYLPDADRHFALGAYLNLDTDADAPLITAIGDTLVKHADTAARPIAADADQTLDDLFGDDARRLKGRLWLAAPCVPAAGARDSMAVLVVFRKQTEGLPGSSAVANDPLSHALVETIAPVLGEKIQQALGMYHRLHPYLQDDADDAGGYEAA
ncbi:MAG TPA: response regulator [Phycisphaerae bacterium]|nr:response regulator [Phycisphaerae bacterium]